MAVNATDKLTNNVGSPSGSAKRKNSKTPAISPHKEKLILYIAGILIAVTVGHYMLPSHFHVLHNVLQRLYYIPIVWAAYRYGRKGGIVISAISGLLYLPHAIFGWRMNPEYQVNQIIEIFLFLVVGFAMGLLFEQKMLSQRLLQSYEKMASFGNLSRSIIRSLKMPLRAIKGMLITLDPIGQQIPAVNSCVSVIKEEITLIENVRNDLMSLVERKQLRLKKQNLNEILFHFLSQVETGLNIRGVKVQKLVKDVRLMAQLNRNSLVNILHQLIDILANHDRSVAELKVYTGQSSTYVWLGATINDIRLSGYFKSELSVLDPQYYHEYNMIAVVNVINNHFGDVRFRWANGRLVEFILVFPKKLKLPWFLRDEPANIEINKG